MCAMVRDQLHLDHTASHGKNRTKSKKSTRETKSKFPDTCRILSKRHILNEQSSSRLGALHKSIVSPRGGILTSRYIDYVHQFQDTCSVSRIRHDMKFDSIPEFAGCPDWIKPIMYRENQVTPYLNRMLIPKFSSLSRSQIDTQVGLSEDWLCSIFSNLTEDLSVALRAAWLSGMIVHKYHMLQAEASAFSRMRAFARKHSLLSKVPDRSSCFCIGTLLST
jgi:hypothetical protein